MESNEKSPIIERLCKFIETSGLSVSQFADRAGIPRPSMSQMLHGRNKSVNNHVLSKLNDAFPELNIVWLLFGRGDMRSNTNIEISEPQNSLFLDDLKELSPQNQKHSTNKTANIDSIEVSQNSFEDLNMHDAASFEQPSNRSSLSETKKQSDFLTEENKDAEIFAKMVNSKIVEREPAKKIASIIVLFTDNSFETFMPSTDS